jgi:hypothetical protein
MPKNAHHEAASHHENAAKAHRTAAEHHGNQTYQYLSWPGPELGVARRPSQRNYGPRGPARW